jgi:signal transduction histidine kinase
VVTVENGQQSKKLIDCPGVPAVLVIWACVICAIGLFVSLRHADASRDSEKEVQLRFERAQALATTMLVSELNYVDDVLRRVSLSVDHFGLGLLQEDLENNGRPRETAERGYVSLGVVNATGETTVGTNRDILGIDFSGAVRRHLNAATDRLILTKIPGKSKDEQEFVASRPLFHPDESLAGLTVALLNARYLHDRSVEISRVVGGEVRVKLDDTLLCRSDCAREAGEAASWRGQTFQLRENLSFEVRIDADQVTSELVAGIRPTIAAALVSAIIISAVFYLLLNLLRAREFDREALENALAMERRQSRAKDMFLANMSHELRTPLNAIIGFSETLSLFMQNGKAMEKSTEYLSHISGSGHYLLRIINDILDMAKVSTGNFELNESAVFLKPLIVGALELVNQDATLSGPIVKSPAIPDDLCLRCDERTVQQIIVNLLSNARKFTPAEGWVEVVVEVTEERLSIRVLDTGPGVSGEVMEQLFTPFQGADAELARKHGGNGLGLWVSMGYAEMHEGDIRIVNREGGGCAAELRLPIARLSLDEERRVA